MSISICNFKGFLIIFSPYAIHSLISLVIDFSNQKYSRLFKFIDIMQLWCVLELYRKSYYQELEDLFAYFLEIYMVILLAIVSLICKTNKFTKKDVSEFRMLINYIFITQMFVCLVIYSLKAMILYRKNSKNKENIKIVKSN